jgi:DNA-binding MarR family transcriptional regulator
MALLTPDPKEPKDLRYRRLHFPNADQLVFDTSKKGFVPLPILMRKLMRHLATPEFRVLAYLHLRASKYGICYPTQQEIAYELGLEGNKNLVPHLRRLETKNLISTKTAMGKKFYLVHDPRHGIQHLVNVGEIGPEELEEINQLCIDLGQELIQQRSVQLENPTTEPVSAVGN